MFEEVIVYSPLRHLSPSYIRKLGLIYDRVILPLPDAIRSEKIQWLNEVAKSCSYTQHILRNLQPLYISDCDFCQPLQLNEYPSLAWHSDIFRAEFFKYVNKSVGEEEWIRTLDRSINVAQDILNFYITNDYLEANEGGSIVFPFSGGNRNSRRLIDAIADVLNIESTKCALHDFEIPTNNNDLEKLINLGNTLESKYKLMFYIESTASELNSLWRTEKDRSNLKAELRRMALELAKFYNQFIDDLERYSKYIEIKRSKASNSLQIARKIVKPKTNITEIKIGFVTVGFGYDEYTALYQQMLEESTFFDKKYPVEHRWQADLLTFRCDADREFGRTEKYKELADTGFWKYIKSKLFGDDT